MRHHARTTIIVCVLCTASSFGQLESTSPSPTAGPIEHPAVLSFKLFDETGHPAAGRLSFTTEAGERPDIFPGVDADPDNLAVRRNVIYSLSGEGTITIPPGRYKVYASRGLECGIDSTTLDFEPDQLYEWSPTLRREIDTAGWVSGDYHLHTLTYSGHGDANMKERLISLIGEGVEFAVATDHNHNTDYSPIVTDLHALHHISTVVGNEVSSPIGHFNTFPLDADAAVIDAEQTNAHTLFTVIRAEQNDWGVVPVIQVNHPRWADIDYFNQRNLDPATGTTSDELFSFGFDSIELLNENEGWGYYDPAETDLETGNETHSVLHDWFHLLNRGYRPAGVGNSDSHTVEGNTPGFPRNYTRSPTDDPGAISPTDVASSIRSKAVFTTLGPFATFSVNGASMGSTVSAAIDPDGRPVANLKIQVQAASWIDCDRVKIYINGHLAETIAVPESRERVRLDTTHTLILKRDSWIALCIEGDDPLTPIVNGKRPILPIAILNPVWIDADRDGLWTPPAIDE